MKLRAYILMEVMVGGLLASVVLAGALTFMAQAQAQTIRGAREQTASSIVQQSVERFQILPFADLVVGNFPASETVTTPGGGSYIRRHTLNAGTQTFVGAVVNTVSLNVSVEFRQGNGDVNATRASTQRYE